MSSQTFLRMIDSMTHEQRGKPIPFAAFLDQIGTSGELVLRSIFQLFCDMVKHHIKEITDEYPDDSESIGFLDYNLDPLFIDGSQKPFFADRLFANRIVNLAESFRLSAAPSKIYVFKGPAGSGKSTFLNNLLDKCEQFVRHDKGLLYEVVWRIPSPAGAEGNAAGKGLGKSHRRGNTDDAHDNGAVFEVPCPNHDNPFLFIPSQHRQAMIEELIPDPDNEFRKKLFKHKQYQWVLKNEPCTICTSIFDALSERYSIQEIFAMIHPRRYFFNRKKGIGISVFNAGDDLERNMMRTNERVQDFLNDLFKDSNKVHYLFSNYANTNQGIRALMDLKSKNIQRFLELHGIISDEVHKVKDIEERIKSLFLVLMNPEDLDNIAKRRKEDSPEMDLSLKDRIHEIMVPYVLDYTTEIRIYTNTYGEQIKLRFMPHVLENFAKIVLASRIKSDSRPIKNWIKDYRAYEKFCDADYLILKMDLYTGKIPEWLTKEDRLALKADVRKSIIAESEADGHQGFSGRESLAIFNDFYTPFSKKRPITMRHLAEFFLDENADLRQSIPRDFIRHLTDLYDFIVLKEVKDSMYSYNEEEISRSILNYLVAITMNVGDSFKNPFLKQEEFVVTQDFFDIVEQHLMIGRSDKNSRDGRERFRKAAIVEYARETLVREIQLEGKQITETKQFQEMFSQFTRSARENVLEPYLGNSNFRLAIKEYDTPDFDKYDSKIRDRVTHLFTNLRDKYGYALECAKAVVLYVFDNDLGKKFGA